LNGEAAALMMRDKPAYEQRVKGSDISIWNWLVNFSCNETWEKILIFLFWIKFHWWFYPLGRNPWSALVHYGIHTAS
jgi:hypothetical protein